MAISQEKVCGWLVEYGRGEVGQDPGWVVELEVIPEVWELYVLEHPKNFDTSNYYGFFAWKRELSLKEKRILKRNADSLTEQIKEVRDDFMEFQEDYLDLWNDFCAEYQNLTPEQIQTAKKFCVLDSVTTPAAPSAPVEYVLDFAVENEFGNVRPGVIIFGPLSSPSGFWKALTRNSGLMAILKVYLLKSASEKFEHFAIRESKEYFAKYPEMEFNTEIIQEMENFVRYFNAGGSQAAPASDSFLVRPDPAPADPAAPAGFVPAVIQGEFAEIQGSVRDSKRDSTLNATNRQTEVIKEGFDSVLEALNRQAELQTQTKDLLEQRIKSNSDLRKRAAAFDGLKHKYENIMQRRAEFWCDFCSPIGLDWKGVYEGEHGRPCDLTGKELEKNRNLYERSIREFRKDEYNEFKRQKKQK